MFRSLFIAAALTAPSFSFAQSFEYNSALTAQLSPSHVNNYTDGQLELDGRLGSIKLVLQPKMPECAEGMSCIQMMPSTQEYFLEGAVASVDHCGIVTLKAEQDNRPVDGALTKIIVRDNTKNTCPTLVALKAIEVQYESAYYNRFEGAEVSEISRFDSDEVTFLDAQNELTPGVIDFQAVIRAQFEAEKKSRYLSGSLFMDGRKGLLEITLQKKAPACKKGRMCAAVMPQPFTVSLEGAISTVDHCGIITTSATKDLRPVDGAMTKITVRHNQNNTCPTFRALKAVEVVYERSYYDRIKGKEVSEIDSFETDSVAFIKPRN